MVVGLRPCATPDTPTGCSRCGGIHRSHTAFLDRDTPRDTPDPVALGWEQMRPRYPLEPASDKAFAGCVILRGKGWEGELVARGGIEPPTSAL